ncbi:MAG: hypothetical protein CL599_17630 [Alteromonas sp.]|nr:hypothetical protein [Alteromonas sp.]OUX84219.1 MAG: hypothetical protein CBB95_16910 [Alteromonas sp. TMED35]
MGKKTRERPPRQCDNCKVEADVQYRVSYKGEWHIICKTCQLEASVCSDYIYGGTWKRNKRN